MNQFFKAPYYWLKFKGQHLDYQFLLTFQRRARYDSLDELTEKLYQLAEDVHNDGENPNQVLEEVSIVFVSTSLKNYWDYQQKVDLEGVNPNNLKQVIEEVPFKEVFDIDNFLSHQFTLDCPSSFFKNSFFSCFLDKFLKPRHYGHYKVIAKIIKHYNLKVKDVGLDFKKPKDKDFIFFKDMTDYNFVKLTQQIELGSFVDLEKNPEVYQEFLSIFNQSYFK